MNWKKGVDRQSARGGLVRSPVFKRAVEVKRLPKTRSGKDPAQKPSVAWRQVPDVPVPATIDDPVILDEIVDLLQSHKIGRFFRCELASESYQAAMNRQGAQCSLPVCRDSYLIPAVFVRRIEKKIQILLITSGFSRSSCISRELSLVNAICTNIPFFSVKGPSRNYAGSALFVF